MQTDTFVYQNFYLKIYFFVSGTVHIYINISGILFTKLLIWIGFN